eukprot:3131366-Amphidinium_carterae.1
MMKDDSYPHQAQAHMDECLRLWGAPAEPLGGPEAEFFEMAKEIMTSLRASVGTKLQTRLALCQTRVTLDTLAEDVEKERAVTSSTKRLSQINEVSKGKRHQVIVSLKRCLGMCASIPSSGVRKSSNVVAQSGQDCETTAPRTHDGGSHHKVGLATRWILPCHCKRCSMVCSRTRLGAKRRPLKTQALAPQLSPGLSI